MTPSPVRQTTSHRGCTLSWLAGGEGPPLVVSGAHDRIAPPHGGKALAEGIPGARYVEIPDGSHGVTLHHPDRINALLLEHLDSAEASWSARAPAGTGTGPR